MGANFSGVVRDAFASLGHDAWSCDLLPTESPGNHYTCDILDVLDKQWDLAIFHPPCTRLAVSGAKWFHKYRDEQEASIQFVMKLMNCGIPRIALENPIGVLSTRYRKPDQIIQPWMFGHPETKATCLWLKNLPKLVPTNDVKAEMLQLPKKERNRVHYMSPGKDRGKLRSITYQGVAEAMANQWSNL